MIFEPKTEKHYTIWVDGFLPPPKTLADTLTNKWKSIYLDNPNDTTLMEEFESKVWQRYYKLSGQSNPANCYAHLLKPAGSHSLPGSYNPIKDEWYGLDNKDKHKYRLFVMLRNTDNENEREHNLVKKALLDTIDSIHFSIKTEDSYRNLERFKDYLGYFSKYLIDRYFFPFQSIRDGIRDLGFSSEDAII